MSTPPSPNERLLALDILKNVILQGHSLTEVLSNLKTNKNIAQAKEMAFGVLRYYERLQWFLKQLLKKPFKEKESVLELWLMLGLYQLEYMRMPSYAVVSEMVEQLKNLDQIWAKGLVNAILRNYLRQREKLIDKTKTQVEAQYCMPVWLIDKFKAQYPMRFSEILKASCVQAPLCLRVNVRKTSVPDYLHLLETHDIQARANALNPSAICLEKALPVQKIPGFSDGLVSVQDSAAQCAAFLLNLQAGLNVLDMCAAPGGKTAHMLELADVNVTALDIAKKRCTLVQENLQRLGLCAEIHAMDAIEFINEHPNVQFERILLDAPCSATGIIRRQPDIKRHRKPADMKALATTQKALLMAAWHALKPKGRLVYATCSLLKEENDQVIQALLETQPKVNVVKLQLKEGVATQHGWQLLPTIDGCDGFYYAVLTKEI